MDRNALNRRLPEVVSALVQSVSTHPQLHHLDRVYLPNREVIINIVQKLRELSFPGYFGRPGLTTENLPFRVGQNVIELSEMLFDQVRWSLRYKEHIPGTEGNGDSTGDDQCEHCDQEAAKVVSTFLDRIPAVRSLLASDVQSAFDHDPAAENTDETIFCYPGLFAITVQRFAHELYVQEVPLLPRIMTEYAHSMTGIDIHPGAKLGRGLFIDHGTGVVIGETAEVGENVTIYQGVTLGAIAPVYGQYLRGQKRHPTIEDNVTIYAGATILGGETVIGKGSVIGGNVFITSTVPPLNQVTAEPPKLKYRDKRPKSKASQGAVVLDFQI